MLLAHLIQHKECVACAVWIGERFVVRTLEEFAEACDFLLTDPRAAPVLKIGEIHVCGDVLPAGIFVDSGTFQSLLEQIGPDAATRAAMIELLRCRAVVDGEYAAGFPVR